MRTAVLTNSANESACILHDPAAVNSNRDFTGVELISGLLVKESTDNIWQNLAFAAREAFIIRTQPAHRTARGPLRFSLCQSRIGCFKELLFFMGLERNSLAPARIALTVVAMSP